MKRRSKLAILLCVVMAILLVVGYFMKPMVWNSTTGTFYTEAERQVRDAFYKYEAAINAGDGGAVYDMLSPSAKYRHSFVEVKGVLVPRWQGATVYKVVGVLVKGDAAYVDVIETDLNGKSDVDRKEMFSNNGTWQRDLP